MNFTGWHQVGGWVRGADTIFCPWTWSNTRLVEQHDLCKICLQCLTSKNRVILHPFDCQGRHEWLCSINRRYIVHENFFNSITSKTGAKFMCTNIKIFYLNTPLKWHEYLCINVDNISMEINTEYKLHDKVTADGYVFIEVRRGMNGLPQAVLLAQKCLEEWLSKKEDMQSKIPDFGSMPVDWFDLPLS